uniref:Putative disease resistance protein RGA3 n=1 Tax=Rhizophora mucronata TaxID=61149 RepID=A0A2P2LUS9_RHIMU
MLAVMAMHFSLGDLKNLNQLQGRLTINNMGAYILIMWASTSKQSSRKRNTSLNCIFVLANTIAKRKVL